MSFWKKIHIIFTLLLLIIFSSSISSAHSEVTIIKITADGFIPDKITVDENATINFINEAGVGRWPASDMHPTHDIYPEFDSKKQIEPGGSWLFKPKKIGVWKFHDHLFPHQKGVVTVISEGATAETEKSTNETVQPQTKQASPSATIKNSIWDGIKAFFSKTLYLFLTGIANVLHVQVELNPSPVAVLSANTISAAEFKKLSAPEQFAQLKSQAKTHGSDAVLKFVLETFAGESGTSGNVHDLTHLAGQLLYEEKGFSGLSLCTSQFAFGCFHGFLDTAFKTSIEKLAEAEGACQTLGTGISGPVASCIHGIGHGVASFHQTKDIKAALNSCDRLTIGAQQYCYDGVFMEFERNASDNFYKTDDPLYPCDTLDPKYSFSCGRNQPQVLLQRLKKNFGEVITICQNAQQVEFKKACFDSLGFIAANQGRGVPQQVIGICQQITDSSLQDQCLKAAAGEIVFQEMPNWFDSWQQICAASSQDAQVDCQGYVKHLIEDYGKLRPQSKGEDNSAYVQDQMQICLHLGGRDDCYQKVAEFFSKQFGLKQSLSLLKQNENVPAVYARCHEVTHYLSRNEYEKTKSVPQVYAQCDSTCHGGCYHGTLEAYLKEKQVSVGDSTIAEKVATVCGKPTDYENVLIFYECLHGLGHAGMFITDMEVPQSLSLCDVLPSKDHRERCYSGVFMENSSSSTSTDHPGKYVKKNDPMYPCNALDMKYQQLCYRYQSSYFAILTNHNWKAVSDLCMQVPPQFQQDCFRTVGTNQVGFTSDMGVMKADCDLMPDQFKATCYAGVIGSFAYRFVGDTNKMIEFCSQLSRQYQPNCLQNIGSSVVDWSTDPQTRRDYCQQIGDTEFILWCNEGIAASDIVGKNQVFN